MAGRGSGRKLMVYLLAMTRLLGLTPSIAHPPRERPLARAVPACTARHYCRGSRVVLPLWGLSAYFLPQKLLCVVYCRKKTLNDRQSRRVNQQSHDLLYASTSLSRLGIARANPRLAASVFYPTIGPCTTSCSVLCLRRGSHAEQRTGGLAHRQRPPAPHPGPAP